MDFVDMTIKEVIDATEKGINLENKAIRTKGYFLFTPADYLKEFKYFGALSLTESLARQKYRLPFFGGIERASGELSLEKLGKEIEFLKIYKTVREQIMVEGILTQKEILGRLARRWNTNHKNQFYALKLENIIFPNELETIQAYNALCEERKR